MHLFSQKKKNVDRELPFLPRVHNQRNNFQVNC